MRRYYHLPNFIKIRIYLYRIPIGKHFLIYKDNGSYSNAAGEPTLYSIEVSGLLEAKAIRQHTGSSGSFFTLKLYKNLPD